MSLPVPAEQTHLTHPKYRADIDGLRAIAVLSVIGYHAFPNLVKGGFVGVDIFFVISGFLISSIIISSLEKGTFSFMEFYARRIKRIFPALILIMAACFVFGWFVLLPDEYKQLGKHISTGAGFVSNLILWQEAGYFDYAAQTKPLLHLWSLGIEEQFYIVWPFLLWFAWKLRTNLLIFALVIAAVSFWLNIEKVDSDKVAAFYSPQTRFWELMAGSILAYMTMHRQNMFSRLRSRFGISTGSAQPAELTVKMLSNGASWTGATLVAIGVLIIVKDRQFPGWWALLPTFGALLIISGGAHAWLNRVVLSHRILVWFGLISYPLYLWHWPILSFARIVELQPPSGEMRIALVLLSVALAWATYRLIEKPIRFGRTTWTKTASLTMLMAITAYVGYNSYARNGLAFRIPSEIRRIVDFNYDFRTDARLGRCWLSAVQAYDGFSRECIETPKPGGVNSIVVWGDSHAGSLYPGLKAGLSKQVSVSQLTRDSCKPILGYGYGVCQKSNDYVISQIQKFHFQTVIMFAHWGLIRTDWGVRRTDWGVQSPETKGLLKSISTLKLLGVKNIVVLGPAPEWNDNLLKLVWKASNGEQGIPERMWAGFNPDVAKIDMQLEEILRAQPVRYVSIYRLMCTKEGCLTHVPGQFNTLMAWDYGHLTAEGGLFVYQYLSSSDAFQ